MSVTQITTVKGRRDDVMRNIPRWLNTDIDELVLVDYACPQNTFKDVIQSEFIKDSRLKVIRVDPSVAGPFYNHGHARNIGVQASKFDWLLFINADTVPSYKFLDKLIDPFSSNYDLPENKDTAKDRKPGVVTLVPESIIEDPRQLNILPESLYLYDQLAVKNAIFYDLNGFVEDNAGWGVDSLDFLIRAKGRIGQFIYLEEDAVRHVDHDDKLSFVYLPIDCSDAIDAYQESFRQLADRRKGLIRAQPGRRFGVQSPTKYVRVFVRGNNYTLSPGE